MIELLKTLQASDVTYHMGWALIHSLWMGAGVAAALAIVLAVLQRRGALARYTAACAALVIMVGGMAWIFWMIPPRPPVPQVQAKVQIEAAPAAASHDVPTMEGRQATVNLPAEAVVAEPRTRVAQEKKSEPLGVRAQKMLAPAVSWVALIWGVGVLLLSLWQLSAWMAARRLCVVATQTVEQAVLEAVSRFKERLRISRPVKVARSMLVRVPMTVGWLRPVILLPASLATGLSSRQLEMLLVHELAHIRRMDYLVNLVQTLVETLLFYHPAVWYISRRIRLEREHCCDDVVLQICGDRETYAQALVACSGEAAHFAVAASGGTLLTRLRRILGVHAPRAQGPSWMGAALALVLVVAIIGVPLACSAGRSQQPVAVGGGMPVPDYSTPQKAALTYLYAMRYANWPALRDGLLGSASQLQAEAASIQAQAAEMDLEAASLDKFGPQKDRVSDSFVFAARWDDLIAAFSSDKVKVTLDGDIATVSALIKYAYEEGGRPHTDLSDFRLTFTKVGHSWKTPLAAGGNSIPYRQWQEKLYRQVAADIRSNKYKTFKEAVAAIDDAYQHKPSFGPSALPSDARHVVIQVHNGNVQITSGGLSMEAETLRFRQTPANLKAADASGAIIQPREPANVVRDASGNVVQTSLAVPNQIVITVVDGKLDARWDSYVVRAHKIELDLDLPDAFVVQPAGRSGAQIPAAPAKAAPWNIEGNIVDDEGKPVADAEVLVLRVGPHMGFEYPITQEIVGRAQSDTDGKFSAAVAEYSEHERNPEVYTMAVARKRDGGFGEVQVYGPANKSRKIVLHKAAPLAGLVVDDAGHPIADAEVRTDLFENDEASEPNVMGCPTLDWFAARTNKDGRFMIPGVPTTYRAEFIVRAAGKATLATQRTHAEVDYRHTDNAQYQAGQANIRIVLSPECRIEGVAQTGRSGNVLSGVRLMALRVSDRLHQLPDFTPPAFATTDKDGRFVMAGLSPGLWEIAVPQPPEDYRFQASDGPREAGQTIVYEEGLKRLHGYVNLTTQQPIVKQLEVRLSEAAILPAIAPATAPAQAPVKDVERRADAKDPAEALRTAAEKLQAAATAMAKKHTGWVHIVEHALHEDANGAILRESNPFFTTYDANFQEDEASIVNVEGTPGAGDEKVLIIYRYSGQEKLTYTASDRTIEKSPAESPPAWISQMGWNMGESVIRALLDPKSSLKINRIDVKPEGQLERYDVAITDNRASPSDRVTFFVDPETHLIQSWEEHFQLEGERVVWRYVISYGGKAIGDIYSLGAPHDAKIVDRRANPRVIKPGESRNGVEVKAAWADRTWRIGEGVPHVTTTVEIINPKAYRDSGLAEKAYSHAPSAYALEIDGKRYEDHTWYTAFPIGLQDRETYPLDMDDHWTRGPFKTPEGYVAMGTPLQLAVGKHEIRILYVALGQDPAPASETVEIEILRPDKAIPAWSAAWGTAVGGVQVSATATKPRFERDDTPTLTARVRNQGASAHMFHPRASSFRLDIDGVPYENHAVEPAWNMPLSKGDEYQVQIPLNRNWITGRHWKEEKLPEGGTTGTLILGKELGLLAPGKHTLRVTLVELGQENEASSQPVEFTVADSTPSE